MPAGRNPGARGFGLESGYRLSAGAQKKTWWGFDVVELTPIPGMIAPDFLAAKYLPICRGNLPFFPFPGKRFLLF